MDSFGIRTPRLSNCYMPFMLLATSHQRPSMHTVTRGPGAHQLTETNTYSGCRRCEKKSQQGASHSWDRRPLCKMVTNFQIMDLMEIQKLALEPERWQKLWQIRGFWIRTLMEPWSCPELVSLSNRELPGVTLKVQDSQLYRPNFQGSTSGA